MLCYVIIGDDVFDIILLVLVLVVLYIIYSKNINGIFYNLYMLKSN